MAMNISINDVLQQECIVLDSQAKTKEQIIDELTEVLYASGALANKEVFLRDVYLREEMGSTGFENHIAIPHGKSTAVLKTRIAIGRVKDDISWETIDGTRVKLVILFAVKDTDSDSRHIKILAKISIALGDDSVVDDLLNLKTRSEMYQLLLSTSESQ
ncbi:MULTISPECIES: PTS sugar transporter subunit IIA [unclassified Brenneria]|uniref:PTS sugar transporter subunit IIA n=1 Tax=unclassified Brenneria TaxID=2634434 RepID=UPI0029C18F68|nr:MULTISPECIES: PTS sugar transporter subunit IIA [unclassified Brenneria]MDX5627272.1 PTS sugar transporter subunit IIA [Brenneria sp. L3-3Z]MDX5694572.1 PTS sugar transporter subunit IIA [Brenneria sp. L4-2C]MEE3661820.1 PTS sugar transporter subunit IIA [Brenneria sp. g21c3]